MPQEPEGKPGSLSDETYTNILAYILRSNDFAAGDAELPSDMDALSRLTIPQLPGQRDLANMSGTSRETVSRTLKLLKDRKECSRKGRTLTIHDLDSFKRKYLG